MILVDYSPLCAAAAANVPPEEDLVRHTILNSIRVYNTKFKNTYGQLVLCMDGKGSWRKEVFPYYKARRRVGRKKSPLDWNTLFPIFHKVAEEIKETFPYKVIHLDKCEADDIIGTLTINYHGSGPIMIVSGDKDFLQLQRYKDVKQFAIIKKQLLHEAKPNLFLCDQIIRGDSIDDVPNVLSDDDTFVNKDKRQVKMSAKRYDKLIKVNPSLWDPEIQENYQRNKNMIDLRCTPINIQQEIVQQFAKQVPPAPNQTRVLNYFIEHKLRNLLEVIHEF